MRKLLIRLILVRPQLSLLSILISGLILTIMVPLVLIQGPQVRFEAALVLGLLVLADYSLPSALATELYLPR